MDFIKIRTKKLLNQEFLYGISSFCTLSENNSFLHGKISYFCIFLAKNDVFNTNRTPRAADGSSLHHGISKDSDLCASAHRCPHYAYARLCFRNSPVTGLDADFPKPHQVHTACPSRCRGRSWACWRRGSRSRR